MTMLLAAPLLYKEVVVDHPTAFLYGSSKARDSNRKEQATICDHVKRISSSFGTAQPDDPNYVCVRHCIPSCDIPTPTPPVPIYTKQEPLDMTETVHLIYSKADSTPLGPGKTFISRREYERGGKEALYFSEYHGRYARTHETLPRTPNNGSVLPNLRRCSFAAWEPHRWQPIAVCDGQWMTDGGAEYERHLAEHLEMFWVSATCHWVSQGPFAHPPRKCVDATNHRQTIHGLDPMNFGPSLVAGGSNTVLLDMPGDASLLDHESGHLVEAVTGVCTQWNYDLVPEISPTAHASLSASNAQMSPMMYCKLRPKICEKCSRNTTTIQRCQ